jgi:class 3 adenylate cyclase
VVGLSVGTLGMVFKGDHTAPAEAAKLARVLDTIAEQLDTVLISVQTATEKHHLIIKFNEHLANPVFESGMDAAVNALSAKVRLPGFALLYRDAVESNRIHYRTYKNGRLEHESGKQPSLSLEAAIQRHGAELLSRSQGRLREALGVAKTTEAVLISGPVSSDTLGKVVIWSPDTDGFSAYTLDLVRVLASTLSQRLMDYNRERIHLSQFFPNRVIDDLLDDPDYKRKYLMPRDEPVGILFADINGFTRICEQVLETPSNIGGFVDRWSEGAVKMIWDHGGVFDKMVGDCVIGLFGPPFFRTTPTERAEAAMRAARDIQKFTEGMSADKEVARLAELIKLPGLGVAVGVNLAPAYCGLFGPNQAYTGFSTGMNQTARLQSLGSFRETLVMDSARAALQNSEEFKQLAYGPLRQTEVKNVSQPLRYHAVTF